MIQKNLNNIQVQGGHLSEERVYKISQKFGNHLHSLGVLRGEIRGSEHAEKCVNAHER